MRSPAPFCIPPAPPTRRAARALLFVLALALVATTASCKRAPAGRAKIAASIFPLYDLTRRIAGPDADVVLVLPPGRSEHGFEPGAREAKEASGARLAVMVGLGVDAWMDRVAAQAAQTSQGAAATRVLKVGDRVPTLTAASAPASASPGAADEPAIDGHVWLDPQRARLAAKAIVEELARVDAAHANAYRQRAHDLDAQLEALDQETERRIATWTKRDFVSFHASFAYFAERYHLTVDAVIEPIPGTAPTKQHLDDVLATVRAKHVTGLFREPQLDPSPAEELAGEAKLPLGLLDPIGGGPDTDGYERLIRFDVAALEKVMR